MSEPVYKVGDDPVVLLHEGERVVRSWRPEPGEVIATDIDERVLAITSDWFWLVRREKKRRKKIFERPGMRIESYE